MPDIYKKFTHKECPLENFPSEKSKPKAHLKPWTSNQGQSPQKNICWHNRQKNKRNTQETATKESTPTKTAALLEMGEFPKYTSNEMIILRVFLEWQLRNIQITIKVKKLFTKSVCIYR